MKPRNRISIQRALALVCTTGISLAAAGCASDESTTAATSTTATATSTDVVVSGTLSTSGTSARTALNVGRSIASVASIEDGTTISCVDPDGNQIAEGAVASDGTFSLTANSQKAMSCSVLVNDVAQGNFIFENSAQKGLSGNSQQTDSVQFAAATNVGAVDLDTVSGNATVDMSSFIANLAKVDVDSAKVTALTGYYKIEATTIPDAAVKAGFKGPCAGSGDNRDCQGPPDGFPLYLKLVHGTVNSNGDDIYGVLVWNSKAADDACGGVVGATAEEMSSELGITLDSGAGEFTYATSASVQGQTKTLIDGWKISDATSSWTMQDCGPFTDGDTHGWECTDASGNKQKNRGGGCFQAGTTTPVQPDMDTDWSGMSCTNTTLADGYETSSCTGTLAVSGTATSVTCTNESKIVKADGTAGTQGDFNWNSVAVKIAQGALCSTAADELTALQCYSQAYYQSGLEQGAADGACAKRISTNWTATSAADFVKVRGPAGLNVRALGTVGLNGLGEPALTALNYEEEYRGVEKQDSSGNKMYVPCRVGNKEKLSISKSATDGVLIATYESFQVNLDTDTPACQAEFDGVAERFMFQFTSITETEAASIAASFQNQ